MPFLSYKKERRSKCRQPLLLLPPLLALLFTILTSSHLTAAQTSYNFNYCGTTFTAANTNCADKCPFGTNAECPAGQLCFPNCNNCPLAEVPPPPPPAPVPTDPTGPTNNNYCGTTWVNANTYCTDPCVYGLDSECPTGEQCFADCTSCPDVPIPPAPPPGPPPPPAPPSNHNYCGSSWIEANANCGESCPLGTDEECTVPGETCFADCTACQAVPIPTPTNYNYCGTSFTDANTNCGESCPLGTDEECTVPGETCHTDCTSCTAVPIPAPPPTPSNHNYCGTSWISANSNCGTPCPHGTDLECPGSETCFADCTNCPSVEIPPPPAPAPPLTDSRLVAYLRNYEDCPTAEQLDGYTHIVISSAVTYEYNPNGNICNDQCVINTIDTDVVAVCDNQSQPELITQWRAMGIKVLLSFGGDGMGTSTAGDINNCWDDCFDRETNTVMEVSTQLVNIVSTMNLDGVDIDYAYCYNIGGSGWNPGQGSFDHIQDGAGVCEQVSGDYSDSAAIAFLQNLTINLRSKLDGLGTGYELSHSPMDYDVQDVTPYFDVLQSQNAKLDFLVVKFYNGITRPVTDGFDNNGAGSVSARTLYQGVADDLFSSEPEKVVFGFCVADCSLTGSNAIASQAVTVLQDVKTYNGGVFACNGGAMMWMVQRDVGGAWSDLVWAEVSETSYCVWEQKPSASPSVTALPSSSPSVPTPKSVYNYNYCGTSWTSANLYCAQECPSGDDNECDVGQTCYADCTDCPRVLVGTLAPSKAPNPPAPFDDTACAPLKGTVNFGYYQEWATYRASVCNPLQPDDIDVAAFGYTHLAFSFAGITASGLIEPYNGDYWTYVPKYEAFNSLKDTNPNLKTLIAVGGWTFPQARFVYAASTPTTRADFAQSVVTFLTDYNFDGIDLDWEYPVTRQGTPADYDNYPLLCEALRDAFTAAGHPEWLITIATAINWNDRLEPGYDLLSMEPHVDWFNVMSYDIYGAWDSTAGANTDMRYIKNTMNEIFNLGIAREKLVLGLAAYGRSTRLTSSTCYTEGCDVSGAGLSGCHGEAGNLPYFEIMNIINNGDYDRLYLNEITGSMELISGGYQYFTSFDNEDTFKIKKDYADDQCLLGVMWWAVDLIENPLILGPTTSPTLSLAPSKSSSPSTLSPSRSPIACSEGCPPDYYKGLVLPVPDCYGFFYCTEEGASEILLCPAGTLFDEELKTCNWEYAVTCSCTGPTTPPPTSGPSLSTSPSESPTESIPPTLKPTQSPLYPGTSHAPTAKATPRPTTKISVCENCPAEGWAFVTASGCDGFYHCLDGEVGPYQACAPGTRFDSNTMGCDYTDLVTCNCFQDPQPTPPTPSSPNPPGPSNTPPPTQWPTVVGGNPWYPDWDFTNECINDGLHSAWMDTYLTDTKKKCCEKNYWWRFDDCMDS